MKKVDNIINCFFSEKLNIAFQASFNEPGNAIFAPINMQEKISSIAILKTMQVR